VRDWLLGCDYASDDALFRERDFWQHPLTFEQLRRGDCEDHALWGWRKLVELGLDAELVIGRTIADDARAVAHAWVLYRDGSERYLLDSVCRSREHALLPLASCAHRYLPEWSVDGAFVRYAYAGRHPRFLALFQRTAR
jgi:predicted transglutaminase-like cysteine proteinase